MCVCVLRERESVCVFSFFLFFFTLSLLFCVTVKKRQCDANIMSLDKESDSARPAGSGHVEAKTHTRSGSNPSPVMLAGIAVGAELLGISDVQVGTMPYDDIMNILRARAQERKDLHFRRPLPREGSFTGVASFARRAAVADGHASHHLHQRVAPEVKAGTTINVQVRPGQLGVRLRPANAARGVGAVVWQFVNIQIEHPGGVRQFVESPFSKQALYLACNWWFVAVGIKRRPCSKLFLLVLLVLLWWWWWWWHEFTAFFRHAHAAMVRQALDSDRTDDMNHDRSMAMLHEREHQAKCLTFKVRFASPLWPCCLRFGYKPSAVW